MADRFKEYKAYLPPKWSGFDELGRGSVKKKMSFGANMSAVANGKGRSASALPGDTGSGLLMGDEEDGDNSDDDHGDGVGRKKKQYIVDGRKLRGSEAWAHELSLYGKEQDQKRIAKERTEELEVDLKKKQKRSLAMKKRALEAPTLANGAAMPSSFHALRMRYPREVDRYNHLLTTATIIDQQKRRDKCDDFVVERQAKVDEKVNNHLTQIDHRIKEHDLEVKRAVTELAYRNQDDQDRAGERRQEKHEKETELRQERHDLTLKKEKELQQRQEAAKEVARQRRAEQSLLTQKRVTAASKRKHEKQSDFEGKMKRQAERAMQQLAEVEMKRRAIVDADPLGQARARAAKMEEEKRQKDLDMYEDDRQKREQRLKNKEVDDLEEHRRIVTMHREKEQQKEATFADNYRNRMSKIKKEIRHHHKPAYQYPEAESRVDSRLQRAVTLQRESAQREVDKQNEMELRRLERESRVYQATSLTRAQQHEAYLKDEEERLATRHRAAEIENHFQETSEQDVTKKILHSTEVLTRLKEERSMHFAKEADEKTAKILEALDLVNVQKTKQAVKKMKEKEAKIAEQKRQRDAKHQVEMMAKHARDVANKDRISRQIQQTQDDRETQTRQKMEEFDEKRRKAQAAKDDAQHNQSTKLHDEFESRLAKARLAQDKKEEKFLRMKKNQADDAENYKLRREQELEEEAHERKMKAHARDAKSEDFYHARKDEVDERMDRTMENLDRVYAKGAMSPAHPFTESFGSKWSKPSMNPPRARTTSPMY